MFASIDLCSGRQLQFGGRPLCGYNSATRVGCNKLDEQEINRWLEQLRVEHRDLDEVISHLIETHHHDNMRVQRLKKRKLKLKDMILKLESELIPDLDA